MHFKDSFQIALSDLVELLATPGTKTERDWRVDELHVMGRDGSCYYGVNVSKRTDGFQQGNHQLGHDGLVLSLRKEDDFMLENNEIEDDDQS